MSPQDMLTFQILAGVFVGAFLVLVLLLWRFLTRLDSLFTRIERLERAFQDGLVPLLNGLMRLAAHPAGEEGPAQDQEPAMGVDRFGHLTHLTRDTATGLWSALTKAAGNFLR